MRRSVNVKQVAEAAGVSVGTVSNVLNRPESVAEGTRARVLEHIRELGFVRNESARLLRAGRSRFVALVVLDVGNPFFTDVARGAEEELAHRGLAMLLCSSDERRDKEQRYLDLVEEQRVQGVLITPIDEASEHLERLRLRGTPVVLLDRAAGASESCSVSVDDVKGGRLVMEHLLQQGHRRVAFVGGPLSLAQVRDRHAGMRGATGAEPIDLLVHETDGMDVASGRAAAVALLASPARSQPTAVFCANDLLALGVLQHLTLRGVRVPADIALVGYDDIQFAAAAAVPLSSVRQPRDELGRAAARLLLEETSGETHRHRRVVFQPELVVRASSDHRRSRTA